MSETSLLYQTIVATHPDEPEAGYARSRIQNIVKAVVPEQDYFAAQIGLASGVLADPTGKPT